MSTDDTLPPPVAPPVAVHPEGAEPVPPLTLPTTIPSSAAASETAAAEAEPVFADRPATEAPPKRKLELRPTMGTENARPISKYGTAGSAPAVTGPVSIPEAHDADVEADIAQAARNVSPADLQRAPSPVAVPEPVALPGSESIDASLEAAVEAAMAGVGAAAPEAAGLAVPLSLETLQPGQKVQGAIQAVSNDSVFVDLGLRLTAAVPFRQFSPKKPPQVGETLEIVFDKIDETEGLILCNLPRGTSKISGDWDSVSVDQIVECVVNKTNKGGLEVSVSSLRGFIPASQVELGYIANLDTYIGQKLRVKVLEVKPSKRKLVLSRRALLAEEREVMKKELMEEIKPDQVRTGKVKTIKEYGAFVDLGGMDGFLPVAQMSWVRIGHPSEVLSEGQEVEVKVLSVDREQGRVSLGMRQLAPNPWRTAETKYEKGSTVTGRVTKVEAFGAFVELEPGVEGLVHISELEHRRVNRVTEVLNVGDMPEVQILEVDPKKKRISLSVKALKAKPEPVERSKEEAPETKPYQRQRKSPLKGGTGASGRSGLFGNPRDFT